MGFPPWLVSALAYVGVVADPEDGLRGDEESYTTPAAASFTSNRLRCSAFMAVRLRNLFAASSACRLPRFAAMSSGGTGVAAAGVATAAADAGAYGIGLPGDGERPGG